MQAEDSTSDGASDASASLAAKLDILAAIASH
jgi:hypothetical protein